MFSCFVINDQVDYFVVISGFHVSVGNLSEGVLICSVLGSKPPIKVFVDGGLHFSISEAVVNQDLCRPVQAAYSATGVSF